MREDEARFLEANAAWNTTRRVLRRKSRELSEAAGVLIAASIPHRQDPAFQEALAKAEASNRGSGTPDHDELWAAVTAAQKAWSADPAVAAAEAVFDAAKEAANTAWWEMREADKALRRARYARNKANGEAAMVAAQAEAEGKHA